MKLLFMNAPFQGGWVYGRWEPGEDKKIHSYYVHATLDGTIQDLKDVLEKEESYALLDR